MKQFYTYLHCKPNGNPFYVGKGSGNRGYSLTGGRNQYYKRIIAKYGKENIGVFIFPCIDEEQAFADEIQQIFQLRREGYELCNNTNGGEGVSGYVWHQDKISIRNEKAKITRMRRRALNKSAPPSNTIFHKGYVPDFGQGKGYKKNPESIAKRSATRKLNRLEREFNLLIWSSPYVRPPISDETRKKMSLSHSGKKHRDFGRILPRITCPNCLHVGETKAMKRWHFDNCKSAAQIVCRRIA